MRRPPSYSDSYIVLGDARTPTLSPLVITPLVVTPLVIAPLEKTPTDYLNVAVLFVIKGSLHLLFISSFESIFYFIYVSKSEDSGILGTINTYYMPLMSACTMWQNTTRALLLDILTMEVNRSIIDTEGLAASAKRGAYNAYLLNWSVAYSMICFGIFIAMLGIVHVKQIPVNWLHLFQEHLAFVLVLGLYEYFFFRTIIYNYTTISTSELNQYIVDGAFQCLTTAGR